MSSAKQSMGRWDIRNKHECVNAAWIHVWECVLLAPSCGEQEGADTTWVHEHEHADWSGGENKLCEKTQLWQPGWNREWICYCLSNHEDVAHKVQSSCRCFQGLLEFVAVMNFLSIVPNLVSFFQSLFLFISLCVFVFAGDAVVWAARWSILILATADLRSTDTAMANTW